MTSAQDFTEMDAAEESIAWWYWNRQAIFKLRAALVQALTACKAGSGAPVLDYGCGNRAYQGVVQACDLNYVAADMPGNAHADIVLNEHGEIPLDQQRYDIVLSAQVLEHVPSPAKYLAEAWRVLKPGGSLVLSTHGVWIYHPSPLDLWRWTADGLRATVAEQGFEVNEVRGVMGLLPMSIQLFQDAVRTRLPTWLSKPLCGLCQLLIGWTDRLHKDSGRARDAMIFVVRATKPS